MYVEDHCRAIEAVVMASDIGETYNVGGGGYRPTNLEMVGTICGLMDKIIPRKDGKAYAELITHVEDRKGHDSRYAIDYSKLQQTLRWEPHETLESGLTKTIQWYVGNPEWVKGICNKPEYLAWVKYNYSERGVV
jgi:dTDP-glucose 4,6-dehydratase